MNPVLLQSPACGIDTWLQGSTWHQCIFNPATTATGGEALFGVLVGGGLILTYYLASSGDLATPSVMTILLGGVLVPALPAGFVDIARAVIVVGMVSGLLELGRRYVMSPGSQQL